MNEVGVGIIGCGIRGRHSYEQYLQAHPAVRLRALAHYPDASPGLREGRTAAHDRDYARALGAKYYGEDFHRLLGRDDIQIISMMVEPGQAATYVEQIAATGKHIISDKPLAGSIADGHRIVESVTRHQIKFMVALNERYAPPFRAARERLVSGSLGNLLALTVTFCPPGPLDGFAASPAYRASFGGGEWANFGCYCADYANWLARSRPVTVYAHLGTFFYDDYREAAMDDLAEVLVRYDNGVIATLVAGRPRAAAGLPWIGADLTCERGSLRVNDNLPRLQLAADCQRLAGYGSPGLLELCSDFVAAVVHDREPPVTAHDGLLALQVVHAAYESASTGRPVNL